MAKYFVFGQTSLSVLTREVDEATVFVAFAKIIKEERLLDESARELIPELAGELTNTFMKFFSANKKHFNEQNVLDWCKDSGGDFLPDGAISSEVIISILKRELTPKEFDELLKKEDYGG